MMLISKEVEIYVHCEFALEGLQLLLMLVCLTATLLFVV